MNKEETLKEISYWMDNVPHLVGHPIEFRLEGDIESSKRVLKILY